MENEIKWRFGVVGNIIGKHTDDDGNIYYGTKAFIPNTKVYICGKYWDEGREHIGVIGRNRFGRIVFEYIDFSLIQSIREQRIYKPKILDIMHCLEFMDGIIWWGQTTEDRKEAKQFVMNWKNKNKE